MADPDYILDLSGRPAGPGGEPPSARQAESGPAGPAGATSGRPFISVHFECCNAFNRVYLNAAGTAYVGWCPRCARKVTALVGPDGTTARSFTAR